MPTWKHFGVILQHFGVILGYFGFTLSSLWRKLAEVGAKLGISWPNLAPSSNPKGPKCKNHCKTNGFLTILWSKIPPTPLPPTLAWGSGLSLFEVSNLEYFGTERTVPTRACGHKGRGPIYGLPPLPPTSFIGRSALVARRMSLVALKTIF